VPHRLLLDVSSLAYRAHFALKDVRSSDGRPMGLVHGYLDFVARLLVSRRPDEVIHVYDHDWRPVARTEIYPGYKANRPPDPEGLPEQLVLLRSALDLTGMLQSQTPEWEAEDAIGALCVEAHSGDRIEMVSGDRDLIQLVRDPIVRLLFTVRGVSELLELDEKPCWRSTGSRPPATRSSPSCAATRPMGYRASATSARRPRGC
jgi:DNA polymerase-1